MPVDKILKIGNVRVRIYGETRPCEQMEAAVPGFRNSMRVPWGGGAFGEILDDGEITVGDPVELETESSAPTSTGTPLGTLRTVRIYALRYPWW